MTIKPLSQTVRLPLARKLEIQMKNITSRFCDYQNDSKRLMDFWLDYRAASDIRLYPTIWRIRLLLTSRVWEQKKDTQIWESESGKIIGFAMIWRRYQTSPYVVLDGYVCPGFATQKLICAILEWGDKRVKAIAKGFKDELIVYVTGLSQYDLSAKLLRQYGYSIIPPNNETHDVYFVRPLLNKIPLPSLPSGFRIRKLQDTDDLAAYQALYGFAKVNPQHQKELLNSDEYRHFVVINSAGEFIAYCECSVCYAEWERTNRRIGWIDYVETMSEQQRKGFGRAVLSAGLLQLQEWGAEIAMLVTVNTNTSAVHLYNNTGFDIVEIKENPGYQKSLPSSQQSGLIG